MSMRGAGCGVRNVGRRGQSLLEYSVLVGAVTVAMIAVAQYVRMAFTAHTIDIEEELSGRPDE